MNLQQYIKEQTLPDNCDKTLLLNSFWEQTINSIATDKDKSLQLLLNWQKSATTSAQIFIDYQFKMNDLSSEIFTICDFYCALHFFPNPQIFEKFEMLGLTKKDLKYFIPIELITKLIDTINASNDVRLYYYNTLKLLQIHFSFKIIDHVQKHFNFVGKKKSGKTYNVAHNKLFDYYRNLPNQQNLNPKKNALTAILNEILNTGAVQNITPKLSRKFLLSNAQGITEKDILKEIINESVIYKCSDAVMYSIVFDFFKLILPHSSLLTEDEFMSGQQSAMYDGKYERYKYMKLKSLLKTTLE